MARIDRLGWAAGMSFISYGIRIGVRVNRAEVLDRLVEYLPPGWRAASSNRVERLYSIIAASNGKEAKIRRFNLLYADIAKISRGMELDHVLNAFESDLQLYVAENARRRTFVHAGVVGWKNRAVVIPGRSYSGKSTLVAELVRAGATYYSDEYAVIDARGRVHPFIKPLSLREPGGFEQTETDVEAIGGSAGTQPLPIGCVVSTTFRPDARWTPRRMTQGNAALAL